jgi:hypothetical protein
MRIRFPDRLFGRGEARLKLGEQVHEAVPRDRQSLD